MNAGGAVTVMSSFAAIWWGVGLTAAGRGSFLLNAFGLATSAVLIVLGWRRAAQATAADVRKHRGRVVGIASGAEGVMIVVAAKMLANTGRSELIAPVVAIIVGLHFLPLARWLPGPIYYLTGALLVIVGFASTAILEPTARTLTVCIGAAAVLWLSCAVVLRQKAARA